MSIAVQQPATTFSTWRQLQAKEEDHGTGASQIALIRSTRHIADDHQKAAKQLAAHNTQALTRMHLISLGNNLLFLLLRLIVFRASYTRNTLILYVLLSAPALAIEFWLEKIGRPTHAENGELKRPGEDMDAKGLTEFMWDVLYWTWACVAAAAFVGNKAWWMYAIIPIYSVWMASSTILSMRQGMTGMTGQGEGGGESTGESKRQKKLEKRGGQKNQNR